MDLQAKLEKMKSSALKEIAAAAATERSADVVLHSRRLEHIEHLIRRFETLVDDLEVVERGEDLPVYKSVKGAVLREPSPPIARERGEMKRAEFIERLGRSGIELQRLRGSVFMTRKNEKVGIAYATERQPNRWFLGLPSGGFRHAILLCESGAETTPLVLHGAFLDKVLPSLSDSNGQVKFNVVRRGGQIHLSVPSQGMVRIDQLRDKFADLK